jgi:hypothetical protein
MEKSEIRNPKSEMEKQLRRLRRWTVLLLLLGVAWRLLRYLLQFPIWGDESMLLVNLLNQDYRGLTRPLLGSQVAPLLFMWGELTAYLYLGASELAVRSLPFVAGMGGLFLFWHLARLTLSARAGMIATGFLAVAIWPVSMGTLAKPYSCDLFLSLALLVPAVHWLRAPERHRWLLVLALLAPVAVLGSYPAVFVAGAVSLALLPAVWRQPGWTARTLFVLYNGLLLGGFLAGMLLVERGQVDGVGVNTAFLESYWTDGFPPGHPLALLKWLFLIHTGQMLAYPVGASDGGSIVTAFLFVCGVAQLWQTRQRTLLVLCLGPFGLGLLAAALHKYPYGASCRLSQHVAPAVCLLAGAGAAALIERIQLVALRQRWQMGVCLLLAGIGLAGMLRDLVHPYRGDGDLWNRRVAREVLDHAGPNDQIVFLNQEKTDPVYWWNFARHKGPVLWNAQVDLDRLDTTTGQVWCLNVMRFGTGLDKLEAQLAHSKHRWVLVHQTQYTMVPTRKGDDVLHCDVYHWVCPEVAPAASNQEVSCWP